MRKKRNGVDDEEDRQRVLDYVRSRPGLSCEEATIKRDTGVAKSRVRNLVRGLAGIDETKLGAGVVCWNPPVEVNTLKSRTTTSGSDDQPIGA